jgi:ribokinase
VVVGGGAYTDFVARGPRLPARGHNVQADIFREFPGGKGFNQAVAAARLGARVAFISCIGSDARGDAIAASLAEEGIDSWFLLRSSKSATGAALLQLDADGDTQVVVAPGPNAHLTADDVAGAARVLTATRVLLVQLEVPLAAVEMAMRIAAGAGSKVVLDPAPPRSLPDELLRLSDVIKPNAVESEVLTGVVVQDRASAQRAAEALIARGARGVAIEAGSEGNLLVCQGGICFFPWLDVERVDTTGAGDAFAAALGVQLADGRALAEAARFANAAAAAATRVVGAYPSMPRRAEVEALLARFPPA